ncbi:unnamed protein product [Rotaria magnacalcarata]|uniref:SH3 domain-containing protein n=2 Tax=Rotaria magnacalcarata TaxID=392030 RepID=A0A819T320_9BILA|nr:unnamed protein product [Rotaria magnacalcarata]CAF2128863.1 unnamed protein product [Rotaria magnacalcarata]CAF4074845.1 unnamed protein product [Rotaria magnacalcarata]CAF4160026.1 unnamed protein product [Rotaria magnacalcarata]
MAKSFIRNFTEQITGSNAKTTDTEIVQAVSQFEDEQSKLSKFKREFDKYTQATLIFDNASMRFFEFIRSLTDASWSQTQTVDRLCIDLARVRGENLQNLNKQMHSNINLLFDKFDKMKGRIDEQTHLQADYDKTRRQYNASMKRDEQIKVDRLKADLDQLKSALNLVNKKLRDNLAKFHADVQDHYVQTTIEVVGMHSKFYHTYYKICSAFTGRRPAKFSTNSDYNENNHHKEMQSSSTEDPRKKTPSAVSESPSRPRGYRVLHQARVIHDYEAENEDELDLVKDEYISIISFENDDDNERDKGWEYAEKSNGTTGIFPVNFAVRLYDNEVKQL